MANNMRQNCWQTGWQRRGFRRWNRSIDRLRKCGSDISAFMPL